MDGRGRAKDNIWIERFWRTIKYDYIYIQPEENGVALYQGILRFIDDYNYHRHHQGIDRQIPKQALPTVGCLTLTNNRTVPA